MEHVTSEDARRNFRHLLDAVTRGQHTEIQRYGEPVAVLVPRDWYDMAVLHLHLHTTGEGAQS